MIREALDRMALGERAVLAGVEVERVSLFGYRIGAAPHVWEHDEVRTLLKCDEVAAALGERVQERLRAGDPATAARIAELRRQHGQRAVRVTGQARAKRARWTGAEAWLVVSYPKETT